jgi:hypothetical protein
VRVREEFLLELEFAHTHQLSGLVPRIVGSPDRMLMTIH